MKNIRNMLLLLSLVTILLFSSCSIEKPIQVHSFMVTLQNYESCWRWKNQVQTKGYDLMWVDDFKTPFFEFRTDSNFRIGERVEWKAIMSRNK